MNALVHASVDQSTQQHFLEERRRIAHANTTHHFFLFQSMRQMQPLLVLTMSRCGSPFPLSSSSFFIFLFSLRSLLCQCISDDALVVLLLSMLVLCCMVWRCMCLLFAAALPLCDFAFVSVSSSWSRLMRLSADLCSQHSFIRSVNRPIPSELGS